MAQFFSRYLYSEPALYKIRAVLNIFVCASLFANKYRAILPCNYDSTNSNTIMVAANKKPRRERSRFEVSHEESQTIVSWSKSLLRRPIWRPKATGNEWMNEWMNEWNSYPRNERKRALYFCGRNWLCTKFYLRVFLFPIWCHLYVPVFPNECKKLVQFFFIDF